MPDTTDESAAAARSAPDGPVCRLLCRLCLRPATADDTPELARVHVQSWREAYRDILAAQTLAELSTARREASWRETVATDPDSVWLALDGDALLGFVSRGACRDRGAAPDLGEVRALYVLASAWGQGVGRALLGQALGSLRNSGFARASLWVLSENARGVGFYRACGFRAVSDSGQWFDLHGQRVHEIAMQRSLLDVRVDSTVA